jgi:diadenosine tetraphosphate (Ap4A) HIT family hydrolase
MTDFILDSRLEADCIILTKVDNIIVLLMDNALLPWFILVPEVEVKELFLLTGTERKNLENLQNRISRFILNNFDVSKLNVAAIGNVVSQLHIHVIGRREDDFAWPGTVWGRPEKEKYPPVKIETIRKKFLKQI